MPPRPLSISKSLCSDRLSDLAFRATGTEPEREDTAGDMPGTSLLHPSLRERSWFRRREIVAVDDDVAGIYEAVFKLLLWSGGHRNVFHVLGRCGSNRACGDSDDGERKQDGNELAEESHCCCFRRRRGCCRLVWTVVGGLGLNEGKQEKCLAGDIR